MRRPLRPLFLARRPYRRRRLRDAARLLPVVGVVLLTLPALWSPDRADGRSVASDAVYFFAVWVLLVAVAAAFAPGLSQPDGGGAAGATDEDED